MPAFDAHELKTLPEMVGGTMSTTFLVELPGPLYDEVVAWCEQTRLRARILPVSMTVVGIEEDGRFIPTGSYEGFEDHYEVTLWTDADALVFKMRWQDVIQ